MISAIYITKVRFVHEQNYVELKESEFILMLANMLGKFLLKDKRNDEEQE